MTAAGGETHMKHQPIKRSIRPAPYARTAIALAALTTFWCALPALADKPSGRTRDIGAIARDGRDVLGVTDGRIVSLEFGGGVAAAGPLTITLPINGASRRITLAPHSVRSEAYEIRLQLADGSYMNVEPGASRTMRGTVDDIEGSVVAASLHDDGLYARIILPDDTQYWVEPLGQSVAGTAPSDHMLYRGEDVISGGGQCATVHGAVAEGVGAVSGGTAAAAGITGLFVAQLGIDVDVEFFMRSSFQIQPDPVAAVEAHVNSVINAVNIQYERDVSIRHVITTILIRTAEPDPYDSRCSAGANAGSICTTNGDCPGSSCGADPNGLLIQFREEWSFSQAGVPRDVAQLFTGKELYGSVIGIAYLNAVCLTGTHYGVVQSSCNNLCANFSCKTDLSAHELGHNWGALHCGDDGPGDPDRCRPRCLDYTMNCTITCSNQFDPTVTIPDIIDFRDSRTCLDEGDDLRRIIIWVELNTLTVTEGDSLQFNALADFLFGEDQIVTGDAIWSVEPPEAGLIDANGLFTASNVNGNTCATIHVAYTSLGVTKENAKTILINDPDNPLAVVTSTPIHGSIDARQPGDPDGRTLDGWRSLDITFNGDTCLMQSGDFVVSVFGGVEPVPGISGFSRPGARSVSIQLSRVIEPGAWTELALGGVAVDLGFLPGDVSGDGFANVVDLAVLMSALSGGEPLPVWSGDVDRSGVIAPADVLRVIDLLNGAGAYEAWLGRQLP